MSLGRLGFNKDMIKWLLLTIFLTQKVFAGAMIPFLFMPLTSESGFDCVNGSPSPGAVCAGGVIYLGSLSPGATSGSGTDKYMTTPGGCGEIPAGQKTIGVNPGYGDYPSADFTPTCSGTDSIFKDWNDGTFNWAVVPGLIDYTATSGAGNGAINTDQFYGSTNTTNIVAVTSAGSGGYHAAARYCDKLNYGGYTDWYLPNRYELNLIYTNKASIPGLDISVNDSYWSSTEYNYQYPWYQRFGDGYQGTNFFKHGGMHVRCVRRIGGNLSLAASSGSATAMNVTGVTQGTSTNGSAVTFTLSNTGDGTSGTVTIGLSNTTNFTVTGGTCISGSTTLAANGSCTIIVTPIDTQNESFSGNLNITANNNPTIALSGTASGFTPLFTYATLDPANKGANITLSGGNLTAVGGTTGSWQSVRSTISKSSGKWYWEVTVNTLAGGNCYTMIGTGNSSALMSTYVGINTNGQSYTSTNCTTGLFYNGYQQSYGTLFAAGNVIGVALDASTGYVTYYKNGVSQGQESYAVTGPWFATTSFATTGNSVTFNFGATPFTYTPPVGYNSGLY